MKTEHTPGPWHVDGRDVCAWDGKTETTICECYAHTSIGRHDGEANARLIAAAPDLLAALTICSKELRIYWEAGATYNLLREDSHALRLARAAIAKAKGI
jgi:hypothetical protein